MYMAANGFYWVATLDRKKPWILEVRKGEVGDQAWRARPGELYHSTTGEKGGLWRMRGRPPQKIWAVGYTAHGADISVGYRQMPDAAADRASWIMKGVAADEIIGNFGLINGGASGLEIDRMDYELGTPPHTWLLASSVGHGERHADAGGSVRSLSGPRRVGIASGPRGLGPLQLGQWLRRFQCFVDGMGGKPVT